MHTTKKELETFLKEEFEYTAFMLDLGKKFDRGQVFAMILRTGNALLWNVTVDVLLNSNKE